MRVKKQTNPQLHQAPLPHLPPATSPTHRKSVMHEFSPLRNQVKNYRKVQLYHYFGECSMPYSVTDGKSQLRLSCYSVWGQAGSTTRGLWSVRILIGDGLGEAVFKQSHAQALKGSRHKLPFPVLLYKTTCYTISFLLHLHTFPSQGRVYFCCL